MKHLIFGYGSLINTESRVRTANTGKVVVVRIQGFQRAWNFYNSKKNRTALGVVSNINAKCNGVIVEVETDNLAAFDAREKGYDRVEVNPKNVEVLKGELPPGKVWIYMPQKPLLPTKNSPIEQSYVDVVLAGCLEFSSEFAKELIISTVYWEQAWVNDRASPNYERYITNPPVEHIDKLLSELIPEAFVKRVEG
jgi:hypothetical protein